MEARSQLRHRPTCCKVATSLLSLLSMDSSISCQIRQLASNYVSIHPFPSVNRPVSSSYPYLFALSAEHSISVAVEGLPLQKSNRRGPGWKAAGESCSPTKLPGIHHLRRKSIVIGNTLGVCRCLKEWARGAILLMLVLRATRVKQCMQLAVGCSLADAKCVSDALTWGELNCRWISPWGI